MSRNIHKSAVKNIERFIIANIFNQPEMAELNVLYPGMFFFEKHRSYILDKLGYKKINDNEIEYIKRMVALMENLIGPNLYNMTYYYPSIITLYKLDGKRNMIKEEDRNKIYFGENMDYKKYISSYKWSVIREGRMYISNYECEICGSKKYLQCHHKTYKRLGDELLSDLIILCRKCHYIFHEEHKRFNQYQ